MWTNNPFLWFKSLHFLSLGSCVLPRKTFRQRLLRLSHLCFRPKRCVCMSKAGMRALIGQTQARHIRFPCAYAAFRFRTEQKKRNYRTGKGKILILVLVPAPVLIPASRSLHSYAFGACACIASENQSSAMSRNAFESFC